MKDYLRLHAQGLEHEVFAVLFLDVPRRFLAYERMFRGTLTQSCVYPREAPQSSSRAAGGICLSSSQPSKRLAHSEPLRSSADAKAEVSSAVETTMSAQAAALVREGMGVALIDPLTALASTDSDFLLKPFEPAVAYEFAALLPEHSAPSRLATHFMNEVNASYSDLRRQVEMLYPSGKRRPIGEKCASIGQSSEALVARTLCERRRCAVEEAPTVRC